LLTANTLKMREYKRLSDWQNISYDLQRTTSVIATAIRAIFEDNFQDYPFN